MQILLSPAKKIAQHDAPKSLQATELDMLDHAEYLMKKLSTYSPAKLKKLMGISDDLAQLNYDRNQRWNAKMKGDEATMAAYAFDGTVYWGLDAKSMKAPQMKWANDRLRILSGLYGVIKPMDLILPYRLEMGTKMEVTKSKNTLYKYWGDTITDYLNNDIAQNKHKAVLNLASNEYFKSVKAKDLTAPVVTPQFKDWSKGEYKALMTYAKKARGLMARYVIDNKIKKVEDLRGFDYEGYSFNNKLSSEGQMIFTRDQVPGKLK